MLLTPSEDQLAAIREVVEKALEECRLAAVRVFREKSLPMSLPEARLEIEIVPEGGWKSTTLPVRISSFSNSQIVFQNLSANQFGLIPAIMDPMLSLAEHLNSVTDLGTRQLNPFPNAQGPEGVSVHFLGPLTASYLRQLDSLDQPKPDLAQLLTAGLLDYIRHPGMTYIESYVVLNGLRPDSEVEWGDTSLRPLTGQEMGVLEQTGGGLASLNYSMRPSYIPTKIHQVVLSTSILSQRYWVPDQSRFKHPNYLLKVLLSLFLHDLEPSTSGYIIIKTGPQWQSFSYSWRPIPVYEKGQSIQNVSADTLRQVFEFADKIPEFDLSESTTQDIVLSRALRGFGAPRTESPLLDFTIALESLLLGDSHDELSFRFALYGAALLRDESPPKETFDLLNMIYKVRSRLVHGTIVNSKHRSEAIQAARKLLSAMLSSVVTDGWPSTNEMRDRILGSI